MHFPMPLAGESVGEKCVTMGFRPENLRIAHSDEPSLPVNVEMVELLGHETLVHIHLDGTQLPLVMRLQGLHDLNTGIQLRLAINGSPYQFDTQGRALG